MTLVIVSIILLAYLLMATEQVTNVNKAAVAIFAAAAGWVLYVCYGSDFVLARYPEVHQEIYGHYADPSQVVKEYISANIFLPYVGKACGIVLFLLATMTIVEILNNNGCFDFVRQLLRTRNSQRMLWTLSLSTFVISANLDNLTTTTMMLIIMHKVIPSRRQRMIFGSAILLAANCGGMLTVIGNPEGLLLWNDGSVTATDYSMTLLVPCLISWLLPTWWIGRMLPERVETEWIVMPYRGDDTRLNVWQRLLMLLVGIGGLWFIPTFHNITRLSPFLGALCVLAVLWIVNEAFNRKLMKTEEMIQRRMPWALQYGVIQMILFVLGMMLAVGVVKETGAIDLCWSFIEKEIHNIWLLGFVAGVVSAVVDNFAVATAFFSMPQPVDIYAGMPSVWQANFLQNGAYWKLIAYIVVAGGNVLTIGSISGFALMKMERMHVGWYFRNVGWKTLVGSLLGLLVLWLIVTY